MKARVARCVGYVWLVLLGVALIMTAAGAYVRSMQIQEYAFGCDPFGYLRMAQVSREATARGELPDYRLETPRTRLLIEFMQMQGIPHTAWGEVVAPHAHHYFPVAGHVAVQYPPGTGLLLAIFPRGEAVHGLNRVIICAFTAVGLLALIVAGWLRAWASAGCVIFALQFGLRILADMDATSYSINAMLVPILLSLTLVFLALVARSIAGKPRGSWALAFLAGVCFGFAVLVRLPVLFLLPGVLILLLGTSLRTLINPLVIAFALGVGLCGALPLLAHQHRVAGMWYLSTYSTLDNTSPSLSALDVTIPFYFEGGAGSKYNWALLVSVIGLAGIVLNRMGSIVGDRARIEWARIVLSVLVVWGISTAYFLTHRITIPYYQIPATFAVIVILALGGLTLEGQAKGKPRGVEPAESGRWRLLGHFSLALALLPGFVAIERAWPSRPRAPLSTNVPPRELHLPPDLAHEQAWIFADVQTGPLWYYARQPAFKVLFTDAPTRQLICRFIFERGEPLYAIKDCAEMQIILNELEQLGGRLESRGEMDGCPYYLVHWPKQGPARLIATTTR
jgi:hypothetical protein